MAGGGGGDGKTPTLNVVSMVDVIFNVIVFFIITAKAASDENVKMAVPKVETPNVHPVPKEVPKLTVSVVCNSPEQVDAQLNKLRGNDVHGAIAVGGSTVKMVTVGGLPKHQFKINPSRPDYGPVTAAIKEIAAIRLKGADPKVKLEILLRADMGSTYDQVRPVMDAISAAGMEKINLIEFKD